MDKNQGLFLSAAPLQLVEVEIPGKTGPVPSGEWGVNVAAARENFPRQGLQLFVPPWSNMGRGDSVAVLLGDTEITRKPISAEEVDTRQTLFIPPNRLSNSITSISYKVTRIGQAPEDSAPTRVLIKLDRPGGQDQDGNTPGHSELKLSLPQEIIEGGVDKEAAAEGVVVTILPYPFMAEHDEIRVTWGGQFVTHTVTVAEVDRPIEIRVEEATILAAGDSGSDGLAVAFEVYDLVDNQSEDWSAEVRVIVDTENLRLAAGILQEAVNNVLDLDKLGNAPATLRVTAERPDFVEGDQIIVRLTGTSADGTPVDITYPPQVVDNIPHVYDISVPNADVRRLAKTQGVFSYQLKKVDSSFLQAKGRFITIIGEPAQLVAPLAKDEQGGSLDPQLPLTTIEVPWDDSMAAGQVIDLKWYGTKPDSSAYFPELPPHDITNGEANAKQPIPFYVDGSHLLAIEGGTLELYYELYPVDDSAVRRSLSTPRYNVGEPRAELPAPTVLHAQGGALDPDTLPPSGTSLVVKRYTGIAIGDELHYEWEGSVTGPFRDWITINRNNFERPEFTLAITLDKVRGDLNGTVTASYWVRRQDDRVSQSDLLLLQIGEAQEQLLDPVTVAELVEGTLDLNDVRNGANAKLDAYEQMAVGDVVYLEWTDNQGNSYTPEGVDITGNMLGNPVPFVVPFVEIEKNLNSTVTAICRVELASGQTLRTRDLIFSVQQEQVPALDPVTVAELVDGNLDLRNVLEGANVQLKAYEQMGAGDVVFLEWTDDQGNEYKPEGRPISGGMVGRPVAFIVPYTEIQKNQDNSVSVICRIELIEGGELRTQALTFAVIESAAPALPAPEVAEANDDGVIDPTTVTAGATVVIGSTAALVVGDKVRVVLSGKVGDTRTHTVSTPGVQRITVPYAVIKANENTSIALQYHVQRGGTGPEAPSPIAEFDVRVIIGGGQLKILGARFNRSTYRSSGSPRYLQAFHAVSNQPLQAEWKYSTDVQWTVASRWRDIQPHLPLQVRTTDDQLTLNPANIMGSGADTTVNGTAAFVAHRDDGRVRGWGNPLFGGQIESTIRTLDDIVEVSCTTSAYAIRRVNGIVMAWGNATNGGEMGGVSREGYASVVGNGVAFAGIKTTGHVVAWGVAASGGNVPAPINGYTDIAKVVAASTAFAALRTTGQVVAWGVAAAGGTVPDLIAALTDIVDINGNFSAFAAMRGNGTVVAWGNATSGGNAEAVADYTDIVEISSANAGAFVAKRATGHVLAWGSAPHGGTLPEAIRGLTDIIDVASNWNVFAAVRANGSVVAWGGTAATGGVVPDEIADLTDVVQVTGSSKAFAVLRRNGMVMAWGDQTVGGDITPVRADLVDVQAVYSNTHGFVALRRDGRVVAWGQAAGGGDNSAVRDQLDGFVSYRAAPAARGRALSAQRAISAAALVG
ncbi:RCC1 domain-containing protein [Pseudomonas sp. GZD-222]|uniref:RCC1 domain-containing protein n=1 Tax=Pseudomonas sp. GZD-222 TaxID=3404805 RepID=UPI003BB5853C